MSYFLLALFLIGALPSRAQFAPQAGVAGSTAIYKNSVQFVSWATGCAITRGLQQIDSPALGYASVGGPAQAIGVPDGNVVSLGDSGVAVLTFAHPIQDGPGADFAVFENGFANPVNPEEAFLELAFVEVSSDGVHFTRFPATSNTQDTVQIAAAGDYMNARLLNNLAGKYIGGYGTPFDLSELAGTPGLDVNAITHVRLVDVIGCIGRHASYDATGRKVNDPFPTPFPSSGFDLDAVGVLHQQPLKVAPGAASVGWRIYPNPASEVLIVENPAAGDLLKIELHDAVGRLLTSSGTAADHISISLAGLMPGLYFIRITAQDGASCTKSFLHR